MITRSNRIAPGSIYHTDVCVIGAGAAGITVAVELGRRGVSTLLITGGGDRYNPKDQDLYAGTSNLGIALERSRQRRFGGTTAVWGGRCIPFDPIDFEPRHYVDHSGWPLTPEILDDYYDRAHEHLDLGSVFSFDVSTLLPDALPHLIEDFDDEVLLTHRLEKFSLPTNLGRKYRSELQASDHVHILMDTHLVRIDYSDHVESQVDQIACVTRNGSKFACRAAAYILAMGGLETTRHLLQTTERFPNGVGNRSDTLGRFFMTHLSGIIAQITINPKRRVLNRYERTTEGVYCRRRLQLSAAAQRDAKILNFSSFLHHPPIEDPEHRDPLLSLLFLLKNLRAIAVKIPAEYSAALAYGKFNRKTYLLHLRNVLIGMPSLIKRGPALLHKRLLSRRKLPSVIVGGANNRFHLHYHVEHAPHRESRVTLSDDIDYHGLRRLHVSMVYKEIDIRSILRAHEIIQDRLETRGVGTLDFLKRDPIQHIKEQVSFGGHQLGTTRMAHSESDGVVDQNCKVFGISNLYVAGPSVFPTGGQSNPVMTIVALAIRLAEHLVATYLGDVSASS